MELDGGAPIHVQGPVTATPLLVNSLLERARMSPCKSCSHVRIVVLVDGVGRDPVDDALTFHRVHNDDEETHQDVLMLLTQGWLSPRPVTTVA